MNTGKKYLAGFLVGFIFLVSTAFKSSSEPWHSTDDATWSYMVAVDSPTIDLQFPIGNPADPNNTGGSGIDFEDPLNFQNDVIYDPLTNSYIINNSVGGSFNYQPPTYMTMDEYIERDLNDFMDKNWEDIISDENDQERSVIPTLKTSKKFEEIFGEGGIDIRPTGTAELTFGINTSRTDNPQIPVRQRRITVFDFNERIQLNVIGSIGDKLKLSTSYNTEATFDFENQMKLEYRGYEDEIIQSIEAGNVSLPLSGSLITGSQSLFGIKTELKFGKLSVSAVLSQQKGKRSEVNVSGGAQVSQYEIKADNYEANKHYFLSQYFRNNYDGAMQTLPQVNSLINITRIEVWITNTNNTTVDTRNIVAMTDLGEVSDLQNPTVSVNGSSPDNDANNVYSFASNNGGIRSFTNATQQLQANGYAAAVDFEKVENARKLTEQEYTYNALLGYISLNQSLNNDEVLAVAFQYTIGNETYQVGEFSTDGIAGQDALLLKLLKPTITNPINKIWDLMMKNVYAIGAYQVSPQDFQLNVWYNNPATSVLIPFLPYTGVDNVPLIQIVGLDKVNTQSAGYPDGYFDFVPLQIAGNKAANGGTINPQNGRVIFTTTEPFGSYLKDQLELQGMDPQQAELIAYTELYDSTKTVAQNTPSKNRFYIKGEYQSSVSSEISLNALNIPQGAVTVTAGGRALQENVHYTVDYNLGRVKIIDDGLLQSQTPIKVSLESNSLFNIQTKTLLGTHFDYRISKDANIGATIMRLAERPLTQKVEFGDEPIKNTQIGLDGNFKKDIPLLTKWIDKYVPFVKTKEKSTMTFSAEAAALIPGHARAIGKDGVSYIDDFEGSQSAIDLRSFSQWKLASIPKGQPNMFPEAELVNDPRSGNNRALISRYVIDPLFFRNNNLTPPHIANNPAIQFNHCMEEVLFSTVFPNQSLRTGTPNNIPVFDLAFYPNERGPYNYETSPEPGISAGVNTDGTLADPQSRWGGIMRQLNTNDFEAANVEFIQFWMMDPFHDDASPTLDGGDLYFNLGNISEDILPDSRKAFENGMPADGSATNLDTTNLGRVPTLQAIVQAFDNDPAARSSQDVGYDLLNDDDERTFFAQFLSDLAAVVDPQALQAATDDPSNDNYGYFRTIAQNANQNDILERYKRFTMPEGNSNTSEQDQELQANGIIEDGVITSATNNPDIEDINRDNNMSESESYFQYKVSMRRADLVVGKNFVNDEILTNSAASGRPIRWIQFKIPIRQPEKAVNGITDFRSIRFIRMFMHDWDEQACLRFARLELIRGEWRRYFDPLLSDGEYVQGDPNSTLFNVFAVNTDQNSERIPINYKIPPGILQEIDVTDPSLRTINEQSLALEVCGLKDGDARAAYKNIDLDVRRYKRFKMFVHAEADDPTDFAQDDQTTIFIRMGTDFTENYYEYELPLKLTAHSATATDQDIWPDANQIDLAFDTLKNIKLKRNALGHPTNQLFSRPDPDDPTRRITVIGNPNLAAVKTIMIGIRNPHKDSDNPWKATEDGQDKCVEVWVNELRLSDFEENGGWAAISRLNIQGADFMRLDLAGSMSTPGWGSIEKKVNERQFETIKQFDASASFELGKFFNEKVGLRIPMFLNYSVSAIDPQYDPLNPDILFKNSLTAAQTARNYSQAKAINFTNVSKARAQGKQARLWDISNWSFTYSYNELFRRDINTAYNMSKTWRGGLYYSFNNNPKLWKPFDKNKFLKKSKWFKIIRDFGIYKGPKQVAFKNDILRTDNENVVRSNFANLVRPQFNRQFTWNRGYDLKYDLSKNIKFDFHAMNNAVIREPDSATYLNKEYYLDDYNAWKDTVRKSIRELGETMNYGHNSNLNITWPVNKIPILSWVNLSTRVGSSYDWTRAPFAQDGVGTNGNYLDTINIGNTIQNSRSLNWTGQLNFTQLYNKVPYLKKVNQKYGSGGRRPSRGGRTTGRGGRPEGRAGTSKEDKEKAAAKKELETEWPEKPTKEILEKKKMTKDQYLKARKKFIKKNGLEDDKKDKEKFKPLEHVARFAMMLKNASFTYTTNDGIMLPGYNERTEMLGMNSNWSAPGWGFIMGQQNRDIFGNENRDFATYAYDNDWMIDTASSRYLNNQHKINHARNFNGRATLEPITGLRIELTADKNVSVNENSNFRWDEDLGRFSHQNLMETGNISVSTIAWKTSFAAIDKQTYDTKTFDNLQEYTKTISEILGKAHPNSIVENDGYYSGYDTTQQQVVVGAFINAYTGSNPNDKNINPFNAIPLPNWRITYDGLSKIKAFKKVIQRLAITHAYRSNMTIANYTTNLEFGQDATGNPINTDLAGNYITERQFTTVTITEQLSPLIGFDATWKLKSKGQSNGLITKFEIKKDRNMALSLANNQVTEILGNEIVIGTGYKFSKVPFPFKIGGDTKESDLNLRLDLSIRSNRTIIRKIIEDQNQITSGQRTMSIKAAADYALSKSLNLRFYFDKVVTNPFVSTTFPTANTNAGLALRFTLAQ